MSKCCFIVSAFNRPDALSCLLSSLKLQTEPDFEVIITDNGKSLAGYVGHRDDGRFTYHGTNFRDCYESANWGASKATSEYLCFPSDDGYYCPRFLALMLQHSGNADLVYCNCIWDGPGAECMHLVVEPKLCHIDKGGFLIRRTAFLKHPFEGPFGENRPEDGHMIERQIAAGISHRKIEMTAWVHN